MKIRKQVTLNPGKDYHCYTGNVQVHVVGGRAWVTLNGRDYYLRQGEVMTFSRGRHPMLVSGIGTENLIYEVEAVPHPTWKRSFIRV
ncbi:MAG: hypothetical protein K8L99_35205 [Anaerolineae bacterium]|nr:hypothetical protein [Anaerolineae bacterium]